MDQIPVSVSLQQACDCVALSLIVSLKGQLGFHVCILRPVSLAWKLGPTWKHSLISTTDDTRQQPADRTEARSVVAGDPQLRNELEYVDVDTSRLYESTSIWDHDAHSVGSWSYAGGGSEKSEH